MAVSAPVLGSTGGGVGVRELHEVDLRGAATNEGSIEGQGAGAEMGVVEKAEDLEVEGLGGGGVGDEHSGMLDPAEPRPLALSQHSPRAPSEGAQGGPQPQREEQQTEAQQRPVNEEHIWVNFSEGSRIPI